MKQKWYVVRRGRQTGVFDNWTACAASVQGYTGAQYKSFPSAASAQEAYASKYENYIGVDTSKLGVSQQDKLRYGQPSPNSICVDAACSNNPGRLEYRGVDTVSGTEFFRRGPYEQGTVNVGEFLAIVAGMQYLAKTHAKEKDSQKNITIVYSDSRTAMAWVRDRQVRTQLKRSKKNVQLFVELDKALAWLRDNPIDIIVKKWETKIWGEIPADFGRK